METKITFTSVIYIEGETIDEIRRKWEGMPLYSEEATKKGCYCVFVEVESAERIDDDSYDDINL